ncbi:ubiquitin c-terminal [Lasallia pustulata]|uniref:Ubiquitin carboxyl-terminal hydrolase n=1 Tax=Lasallia pustulata TaxID=136370 RepID=A0A1W5CSK6_9LECA|nr:ubiquitin c-terminal [Lasallia pustulata]
MVAPPYPTPQGGAPMPYRPYPPPHAPSSSSIRSQQDMLSPSSSSASLHIPPSAPPLAQSPRQPPPAPPPHPAPPTVRVPFYPPLPWYSVPDEPFPPKSVRRRRKKPAPQCSSIPVELPLRQESSDDAEVAEETTQSAIEKNSSVCEAALEDVSRLPEGVPEDMSRVPQDVPEDVSRVSEDVPEDVPTLREDQAGPENPAPVTSSLETPVTSHAPSEADSTHPTTPSSTIAPQAPTQSQKASGPSKNIHRPAVPLIPVIPIISNTPSRPSQRMSQSAASGTSQLTDAKAGIDQSVVIPDTLDPVNAETSSTTSEQTFTATPPPTRPPPKSWADLVRTKASSAALPTPSLSSGTTGQTNGFAIAKAGSLSDVLSSFKVVSGHDETKIAFLEPRGLVNTGNMCYMNAILQILLFCTPFYDFLDKVGKQAMHSFKSDTPMVDAMIMFMREFPVIDSAVSVEQLRMRLKDSELEQYGEAFIPEFVYEVIRRLPRFATMRRGHQQDAEEFLGFLLEEMHEECVKSMKSSTPSTTSDGPTLTNGIVSPISETGPGAENGWLEVGPKQKAAITRLSGAIAESPVTKIFGGKIRSELRVPGMKNSVTSEPYQPLQLDIGSPQVNNITDALKGLTRSETLHGDFNSPRGPGVAATKQMFIDTLPAVLILHLKRFQYDNAGGTQKIWKKVGYPLELEIPKEVFPPHKRGGLAAHGGLPKYRLIGVVYHHGKNASGGHYTVDVRRQEGREWIRLDDTIIRRVRSDDVAEGGSEEDPKILAAALEQHKRDQSTSGNLFEQVGLEDDDAAKLEKGWSQVNGATSGSSAAAGGRKWSGVVNGMATPASESGRRTPVGKAAARDSKVAYILFYQRIGA